MPQVLTSEQINQVVNNTVLTLLVRPDLLGEWHTNLFNLMIQARDSVYEDEAIFLAAVLTLLHHQNDDLPTGTKYDRAWEAILIGLQTGVMQPTATQGETMSLDRLLNSVVEAVVTVRTQAPGQRHAVSEELHRMRLAAADAEVSELIAWLDDALELLDGMPSEVLDANHQGVYAVFWETMVRSLNNAS